MRFLRPAAAALIAALLVASAPPADAQRVTPLPPRAGPVFPPSIPGSEPGEWRSRSQLVWDVAQSALDRRLYTVWDPSPSDDLDFRWEPADPVAAAEGRVAGEGTVVWLTRGAPVYDKNAVVATISGAFRDGRAEGRAVFRHRSGVAYDGAWRGGLMHGQGRLTLPNGDAYIGGFADGRLAGEGVYIDAAGVIYEGSFADNRRDGIGTVSAPDGRIYAASWRAGSEEAGSRRLIAAPEAAATPAQYQIYDDFRLGVIVEQRLSGALGPDQPLYYTSLSTRKSLEIFPDYPKMLDIWRGRANLRLEDAELYQVGNAERYEGKRTFIGLGETRTEPVRVVFEFENRSNQAVEIQAAYLEVADSETDLDPAVQLRLRVWCDSSVDWRLAICPTVFDFENFGWSNPIDARLNFTFHQDGRRMFSRDLGEFAERVALDFDAELAALGVDRDALQTFHVCDEPGLREWEDRNRCLQALRSVREFGDLAGEVFIAEGLGSGSVGVMVRGTLDYDWVTAKGERRSKSSPFDGYIKLATLPVMAEEGEGGDPAPIGHEPFVFDLDRAGYRIPLPLRSLVEPGVSGRWRIELEALKSSNHAFRIVTVLSDGRRVASRPIDLLYVKPRVFPAD